MINYSDPGMVTGMKATKEPGYGRTVTGYGGKLPTRYMVQYGGRWRRVYMMQYGNSGSAYIVHGGSELFLDMHTQIDLEGVVR
jgi:hypothetical protein